MAALTQSGIETLTRYVPLAALACKISRRFRKGDEPSYRDSSPHFADLGGAPKPHPSEASPTPPAKPPGAAASIRLWRVRRIVGEKYTSLAHAARTTPIAIDRPKPNPQPPHDATSHPATSELQDPNQPKSQIRVICHIRGQKHSPHQHHLAPDSRQTSPRRLLCGLRSVPLLRVSSYSFVHNVSAL